MKSTYRISVFVVILMLLTAVIAGCQKKITKVEKTPMPEAQAPAPKPAPIDTTAFVQADLTGDLAKQAKDALQDIYFEFDQYDLRQDAIDRLVIVAKFLSDHPGIRILIAGNCDDRGSAEYNMGLGERRSNAAKEYLTHYGISVSRLESTSYGKEKLAVTGCTDDPCHAKNRRDGFTVLEGLVPVSTTP